MYQNKELSAVALYWFVLIGFFGLLTVGFLSQLDWTIVSASSEIILTTLSILDYFLMEVMLVMLVGGLCLQGNILFRLIAYAIALIFFLVNALQAASFYQTGIFISKLATENMNHVAILLNFQNSVLVLSFTLFFIVFVFLVEKRTAKKLFLKPIKQWIFYSFFLLISLAIAVPNILGWWPEILIKQRDTFLSHHQLLHHSPIWSLYDTLFVQSAHIDGPMTLKNLAIAKEYGFHFQQGAEYPLIKDAIYRGNTPFVSQKTQHAGNNFIEDQPNIIVFFTEGYSARTMNVYGSEYAEITPNLNDFAKHSMVVDNYYNHTAATYRGLHGQLCSIFPKYGGVGGWHTNYADLPQTDYFCLSHLLNNYDYQTIFLFSQLRDTTFIDEMMGILGFDQVWAADSLAKNYLKGQKMMRSNAISDQQLFVSLIGLLKDLEKQNVEDQPSKRPFFISLYNFETHAWLDVLEDGKAYGKGDNISLNTIHNLDDAFGRFWKYYQQSSLAENTIIIFTADHCHYHEKSYVEAVKKPGSNYQSIFVDQIPLIIHDPTRKLPNNFDARFSSSIDFAPSLVHFLGLENHQNPFMGSSIFEKKTQREFSKGQDSGIASLGNKTYIIDQEKIHGGAKPTGVKKQDLMGLHGFIKHIQWLEAENRVWDASLNESIKNKVKGRSAGIH